MKKNQVKRNSNNGLARALENFSCRASVWTGGSAAFAIALAVILIWALTGPLFHYSDTWQLVINTGTTIVTFLMVFLIQRAQNKESQAVQLKLNELVAAMEGSSNRLIGAENLSEADLTKLKEHYATLAQLASREEDSRKSHSVEEAESDPRPKLRSARKSG